MVYHETRIVKGKKMNYLIYNKRESGKWVKKAKFIGVGNMSQKKIKELKGKFEIEIIADKKYLFLKKDEVNETENLKRIYNEKIKKLKKEEYEEFQKSFFTELTYNSNAIEGNSLSLQETHLIINEGIVPQGKTLREIYEARNHLEAIKFVKSYKMDLDEKFILKLHSIILKNISDRFAGRYRETNVRIFGSDVKFPSPDKVPQLVRNLVYRYKRNKKKYHPFELATITSMEFVTMHPFIDGNGRVSRLIMNFLLNKKNYPWINIYNSQRQKYLQAVRKASDENYSLIFPFFIDTLKENLKDFNIIDVDYN